MLMNVDKLKTIFKQNNVVKFKMYGLDYTIKNIDNGVVIFVDLYPNKKSWYNNIDSLLKNYNIYNENIESNDQRIQNIH